MTSASRWQVIDTICGRALELDDADRSNFIARRCDGDDELRQDVERLVAAALTHDDFLAPSRSTMDDHRSNAPGILKPGEAIGRYSVIGQLSRGGMGRVYAARRIAGDDEQIVAVKVLDQAVMTARQRERFDGERRALARLRHPNITVLIDGGTTSTNAPYLVMEYVDGTTISEFCRRGALAIRARVELMLQVCAAVQHAHEKLIIHRDIKPSNVLVDADGRVRLIDFGIAKLVATENRNPDRTATVIRTPAYSSPEQIRHQPVTTRTDVHALGVLLHEVLAGMPPFRADDAPVYEIERRICEGEVRPPSQVAELGESRRTVRGDLDAICRRAMAAEPDDRYGSVEQLAADLRAWLDHRPVLARGITRRAVVGKFVRRHRVPVVIAAVALLGIAASGTVAGISWLEARQAAIESEQSREDAMTAVSLLEDVLRASDPLASASGSTLPGILQTAEDTIGALTDSSPELRVNLHLSMAHIYRQLSSWPDVVRHSRQVLRAMDQEDAAGDWSHQRADALILQSIAQTELAYIRGTRNHIAIRSAREALEIRRSDAAEESLATADAMRVLAMALWIDSPTDGIIEEAAGMCRDSIEICERLGFASSLGAAESWSLLANLNHAAADDQAQRHALERAHAIYQELAAAPIRAKRSVLFRLAEVRFLDGDDDRARTLLERGIAETPAHSRAFIPRQAWWMLAALERRVGADHRAARLVHEGLRIEFEQVRANLSPAARAELATMLDRIEDAIEAKQPQQAFEAVSAAVGFRPEDPLRPLIDEVLDVSESTSDNH